MKKLLLTLVLTMCASIVFAGSSPWDKKLPFKNAVISYEMNGTYKGTKQLYIKDYGKNRAEYSDSVMKILGIKKAKKELTITTPDWVYTYSEGDSRISKQTNPLKFYREEYSKLSSSDKKKLVKNMESTGISTVKAMDGTVEKAAVKILGYTCDKVTLIGITSYTITGTDISLKAEGKILTIKEDTQAVSIDKVRPPSAKFELPSGIEVVHSPEADIMMQEQARSSIQAMLEGDGKPMVRKTDSSDSGEGSPMLSDEQKKKLKGMMNMFGGN